jgi:hypothetical protein
MKSADGQQIAPGDCGMSVLWDVGMDHSGKKHDDFLSDLCELCGELLPFGIFITRED